MTIETDVAEIKDKLNQVLAALSVPAPQPTKVPAYALPPLTKDEVIADGTTTNADGSTWITSSGESGPPGTKVRIRFGYFTPEKCPESFVKLREVMGPSNFDSWNASRDPWALYANDPRSVIFLPGANFMGVGYALQSFGRLERS